MDYRSKRRNSRKMLQGFGDFRPELGPLKRRRRKTPNLVASLIASNIDDEDIESDSQRCSKLREMAQELSLGLRKDGLVTTHTWYHRMFPDTFSSADAVRWVIKVMSSDKINNSEENALVFLQELLDYGYIRRVSKRESSSSIGWEATEHVVRSKRRFKHTKHTLYRFDDELSEIQLRVTLFQAQMNQQNVVFNTITKKRPPKLFARLEFNGRVQETLAVKKSTQPQWRAHFVFGLDTGLVSLGSSDTLIISVFQKQEPFSSKLLGSVNIFVSDTKLVPRIRASPNDAYLLSQAYTHSYKIKPAAEFLNDTSSIDDINDDSPICTEQTQSNNNKQRNIMVRSSSMRMSSSSAMASMESTQELIAKLDLSVCLVKTREDSMLLQNDALDEDGFIAPGATHRTTNEIGAISNENTPRERNIPTTILPLKFFGFFFWKKLPASPSNMISPTSIARRVRRPSLTLRNRRPSSKSISAEKSSNISLDTKPLERNTSSVQKNHKYIEKRGGPRHWRLCALVESCEGVRYDLAETSALPWVMEVKVIVGATVAVTHAVERDRSVKGARWSERLALDVFANRRVEEVKLVVCQRGRYDLMTRHVGAVSLPLSRVPVISREDQNWVIPPSEAYNLQRLKHGIVRGQHNGTLRVSVWLRDIRPLDPAPFGLKHLLALDLVLLVIIMYLMNSLLITLLSILLMAIPWFYLYRFDIRPSRILGLVLTLIIKSTAQLGLNLSFKHVAISAWVRRGRLHVAADVEHFAFSNPGGGVAGFENSFWIFSARARRNFFIKILAFIKMVWQSHFVESIKLILSRRRIVAYSVRFLTATLLSTQWRYRQYAKVFTTISNVIEYSILRRLHFDDWPLLERNTEDMRSQSMRRPTSTLLPRQSNGLTRSSQYNISRRSSCDTTLHSQRMPLPKANSLHHELSPHLLFPPRFVHEHFFSAAKVRVEVSACISSSWGLLRFFVQLLRPAPPASHVWRGSPSRMATLRNDPAYEGQCLGLLRIEELQVEDAELNFCTSRRGKRRGEFCINSVVRRIADTKVASALAKARIRNTQRNSISSILWSQFTALLHPLRQSRFEVAGYGKLTKNTQSRPAPNEDLYWPNTLKGVVCMGHFPGADKDSTQYKVVVRARGVRLESEPQFGPDPAWNLDFRMECDDASTVLHLAVYEIRTFPLGPKLVGQWVMTLKYLVTNPRYCAHTELSIEEDQRNLLMIDNAPLTTDELRSLQRWINITAILSDGQWLATRANIKLRLRWSYVAPPETNRLSSSGDSSNASPSAVISTTGPNFNYPKALEQLRLNSEETRLRVGDTEAVRFMLSTFPFRLEMRKFQVLNLRFFAKDLFLGAEGEVARLQSRHSQSLSSVDHTSSQRLQTPSNMFTSSSNSGKGTGSAGDFDAIRMTKLLLDGSLVAPIHQGGYDLAEFARTCVNKLGNEILRSAPIMSAVYHIMPLLAGHMFWGSNKPDASSSSRLDAETISPRHDKPRLSKGRKSHSTAAIPQDV